MSSFGNPDSQRQILALIRDFATEQSQGERRVFDLRKRLQDLRSDLDASSSALSHAKISRDAARDALNSAELELSVASSSVLAQQARAGALQDEIAKIGLEIVDLKEKKAALREEFLASMFDLNKKIRKFHASFRKSVEEEKAAKILHNNGNAVGEQEALVANNSEKDRENEIACTKRQIDTLEKEFEEKLSEKDQVLNMLASTEKRLHLAEAVMSEMKQLQELGQQTTEAERTYAYLGEQLKKKYTCPGCQLNNMGELQGTLT